MCNPISPLFGIEKTGALKSVNKRFSPLKRRSESELHLRVADCHLFLAKTDYPLPPATLFSHFSESKKSPARINDKRFSRLKRRRESVAFSPHIKLSSAELPRTSEILFLRSQMLRTARYGVLYKAKLFRRKCYFLYSQTVNRTCFSAQLAIAR